MMTNTLITIFYYAVLALLGTGHPNASATGCQELHPTGIMWCKPATANESRTSCWLVYFLSDYTYQSGSTMVSIS